ncbi:MAG: MBL fold metallo-hydrolase [Bacteroidetes bacterium]|nr:MBL fold metallo-hydrolase [Bacteroidota bacterium]
MSIFLAALNSGSNGNCYYVGNEQDAVLVDAGISCRETERRMSRLGLTLEKVRAVFISHEHTDHIRGAEVLSRKYKLPVYLSVVTYLNSLLQIETEQLRTFSANERLEIGSLNVCPFPKLHDGADPYSFTVMTEGLTAGVFTDIGEACPNLVHHFGYCHAAFLEANYDEVMLDEGNYPVYLKNRIKSKVGHLSNNQALDLFNRHKAPYLSHLILSHLSEHNNHPDIVNALFAPHANGTLIEIASRYEPTGVFCVTGL